MTKEEILKQELDRTGCFYAYNENDRVIDDSDSAFDGIFSAMEIYADQQLVKYLQYRDEETSELNERYRKMWEFVDKRIVECELALQVKEWKDRFEKIRQELNTLKRVKRIAGLDQ